MSGAHDIQVGEREQGEHQSAVLGDAAIENLAIAELAFDDAEDVQDLRTCLAEAAVACTLARGEERPSFALSFTAQSTPAACAARFFASPSSAPSC
jgi:hypothetical protein